MRTLTSKSTGDLGGRFHDLMRSWKIDDLRSFYRHAISFWTQPSKLVLDATESTLPNRVFDSFNDDGFREMMVLDATSYLPDDILVKVDRAAMAVSLETRIPLLDHRVVDSRAAFPSVST